MLLQRADGVRRAAGVVAAGGGERGGDEPLVEADRGRQHTHRHGPVRTDGVARRGHRCCARRSADRRSRARSSLVAVAADGNARTTTAQPGGSSAKSGRTCSRNRRVTRCRTTLLPTAEETTKPARAGRTDRVSTVEPSAAAVDTVDGWAAGGAGNRWRARCRVPARRPVRSTAVNSAGLVTRIAFDSTGSPASPSQTAAQRRRSPATVRPTAPCGPSHDGWPGWRGPHGYASAGGSRGSWPGAGCSAEKYACSRQCLQVHFRHMLHVGCRRRTRAAHRGSVRPSSGSRVRTDPEPGQGETVREGPPHTPVPAGRTGGEGRPRPSVGSLIPRPDPRKRPLWERLACC